MATPKKFSNQLEAWLKGSNQKTLDSLIKVFRDKSFAIIFLFLMIWAALPLPTGGVTHVFEVITMLVALEMLVGLKEIWLPKKWRHRKLGKIIEGKVVPTLLGYIRWFEKRSSPRGKYLFKIPLFDKLVAILVLVFAVAAFLAPPFSFLDTLPALGIVIISLALILEDFVMFVVGVIVGVAGIGITLTIGTAIVDAAKRLL